MSYCGKILILGRSNVGKSTLINKIVGSKVSIVSNKVQTTKSNILGINTENKFQAIYIDTPGVFLYKNRYLNILKDTSINNLFKNENYTTILLVVENIVWTNIEEKIINYFKNVNNKIILVINKIDILRKKNDLLPYIYKVSKKINFIDIIPISAKKNFNINKLKIIIFNLLPNNKHIYSNNLHYEKCKKKFLISEIIREKLIKFLNKELPYNFFVRIEKFYKKKFFYIYSTILVKKNNHKKIIIGKKGKKIKMIRKSSQKELEKFLLKKCFLYIWIKIKF